jgi:fermentation-respiration switch protein FrsA (DUF1100 family)
MNSKVIARAKAILLALCLVYLCICVTACTVQRELLYHPFTAKGEPEEPKDYGLADFTDVRLRDKDGTRVDAWYREARPGYPTIVFFHGNGGNIGNRALYYRALADAGFGLLALDYRGYGASEGSPSEEGIYQDARAAMEYAAQTQHLSMDRIVLYGESLGTGVAVQMATEFPVGAIVLQSPYTSIESVAKQRYPFLPVHYLLWDRFDSLSKIASVHAPLLLFHGESDSIIPIEEGKKLFAAAGEPKEAVYFPGQGHNDLDTQQRVNALTAFVRKHGFIKN